MGGDFWTYLSRLELIGFFAGYPLVYALVHVLSKSVPGKKTFFARLLLALPLSYALCGTLYLGLQLKNMYPDYSPAAWGAVFSQWLKIWGLLALLFWLPFFRNKSVWSLVHSLVVFFFLVKDLWMHLNDDLGREFIKNDMMLFTGSLLLHAGTLLVTILLYHIYSLSVKFLRNRPNR